MTTNNDEGCYAMVGYRVGNTVTEHGSVSRGVCRVENGMLVDIVERAKIYKRGSGAAYTEDGETFVELPGDTLVSMNMWGFTHGMMEQLSARFPRFLDEKLPVDPIKCEYFLPFVPDCLIRENKGSVQVLKTHDHWYGMTYREDLPSVREALKELRESGLYPENLWR